LPDLRTVEFALDVKDYAEYSVFVETRSRFRVRAVRRLVLFSVGPAAVAIDLAFGIHPKLYQQAGGMVGLIVVALFIGGALVLLSWLTRPTMTRFAARRRFRDGTFGAYTKPQKVEISAEGIRFTGAAGESLTPWSAVVDIAAEPNAIYFLVTSLSAYIVPRRAFSTVADFNGFLRSARQYRASAENLPIPPG
jgi:hypothetical protein